MSSLATPTINSAIEQLYDSNSDLSRRLGELRNKPFKAGHRVILAKALADVIALPPSGVDDFAQWFLTKKISINSALDKLSNFVFIEEKEAIYKLTRDFAQWRYSMIYNPPHVMVARGSDCVVDEVTGITSFVDGAELATLADVYSDINHYYMLFRTLANLAKSTDR